MQYPNLGFGLSTETGQARELASLRPWSTVLIQAVLLASFTRLGEGDDGPLDLLALVLDRVGVREVGALGAPVDHEVPRRVLRVVQDVEAAVVPVVLPHDVDVGEAEAVQRFSVISVITLSGNWVPLKMFNLRVAARKKERSDWRWRMEEVGRILMTVGVSDCTYIITFPTEQHSKL